MIHLDIVLDRMDSCSDPKNRAAPVVEVSKGTQQGCDLSAPVFFLRKLCPAVQFKMGIKYQGEEHVSPILRFSDDDHF